MWNVCNTVTQFVIHCISWQNGLIDKIVGCVLLQHEIIILNKTTTTKNSKQWKPQSKTIGQRGSHQQQRKAKECLIYLLAFICLIWMHQGVQCGWLRRFTFTFRNFIHRLDFIPLCNHTLQWIGPRIRNKLNTSITLHQWPHKHQQRNAYALLSFYFDGRIHSPIETKTMAAYLLNGNDNVNIQCDVNDTKM